MRIVCIDDDRSDQMILKAILCKAFPDVEFLSAIDGGQGLALMREKLPDVILLDIVMPGLDGFEVCGRLRSEERTAQIPVIALTAFRTDRDIRVKVLESGADVFLHKPIDDIELVAQVRAMFRLHERRKAGELLKKSEERYRQILRSTTDYIYMVRIEDGSAVETAHGAGCVAVTGYAPEEYLADPELWYRMVHPDDRQKVIQMSAGALKGEKLAPLEHRVYHKDGKVRWLRNTIVIHRDAEGRVVSYDGLVSDITARKLIEEENRQGRERLQIALQSAQMGAWAFDVLEGRRHFDAQACRLLGIDPGCFNGTPDEFFHCIHPEDREAVKMMLGKVLGGHLPYDISYRVIHPGGEVRYVGSQGRLVCDPNGRPIMLNGVIWDETRARLIEQTLKASKEQAEELNRKKSEFLMNISHDLRTPLNAVVGFSSMLARLDIEEKPRQFVNVIREKAEQLLALVEDVLVAARLESGAITLRSVEFDPAVEIEKAAEAARHSLRSKPVLITCCWKDPLPRVKGDPVRFAQIFENILMNALKYSDDVRVRIVGEVLAAESIEGRCKLRFTVEDEGWVIPMEKISSIFEPFVRLDEKTSINAISGAGLGLHIVRTIVMLMGGTISVTSGTGKGSSFIFTLDLARA